MEHVLPRLGLPPGLSPFALLFSLSKLKGQSKCSNTNIESEPGGAARQAERLRQEGVTVYTDAMGEMSVELVVVGWFPSDLPVDI